MSRLPANGELLKYILRYLLSSPSKSHGEDVRSIFHQLGKRVCEPFNIYNIETLQRFLQPFTQIFHTVDDTGPSSLVSPTTSLELCIAHSRRCGTCSGQTCQALHFCKFYLLSGKCPYGQYCLFGHSLEMPHNRRLLAKHLLDGLNLTELRQLFCLPRVRTVVTVPKVCRYYNIHRGCTKLPGECRSLHLCRPYVLGHCKFGKGCKRNHQMNNQQVSEVLAFYGINKARPMTEILQEVRNYETEYNYDNAEDDDDNGSGVQGGFGARARWFGSVPDLFRGSRMSPSPPSTGFRQRHPSEHARTPQQHEERTGTVRSESGAMGPLFSPQSIYGSGAFRQHGASPRDLEEDFYPDNRSDSGLSHNTALSMLNAAPQLLPDSMFPAAVQSNTAMGTSFGQTSSSPFRAADRGIHMSPPARNGSTSSGASIHCSQPRPCNFGVAGRASGNSPPEERNRAFGPRENLQYNLQSCNYLPYGPPHPDPEGNMQEELRRMQEEVELERQARWQAEEQNRALIRQLRDKLNLTEDSRPLASHNARCLDSFSGYELCDPVNPSINSSHIDSTFNTSQPPAYPDRGFLPRPSTSISRPCQMTNLKY